MVCTYLVIEGLRLLGLVGKPDSKRDDPTLMGLEKTTELVTTGLYCYIRHPLYGSLIFLAWGACLKRPDWVEIIMAMTASFLLFLTARIEESENISYFGPNYKEYMKRTKMFIPGLF